MPEPSFRAKQIAAFAAVYVIWGSTYLAIQLLIDTLPGFVMVGFRFLLAGLLLGAWALWRGAERPSRRQWRDASIVGVMLLFGGTGAVVWAAEYTQSGLLALLVGMEPLWVAGLLWLMPSLRKGEGEKPTRISLIGLLVGFAGVAVLAAPSDVLAGDSIHLGSIIALLIGSLSWAGGSLYSRHLDMPKAPSISSAVQMLAGGAVLIFAGLARGEMTEFQPQNVSTTSVAAFLYLIVFGSIVAFSAYAWLLRNTDPNLIATHTYVNPVVAVFLGWWIANEQVGARTLVASALIIGSVVLTTWISSRRSRQRDLATARARERREFPLDPAGCRELPKSLAADHRCGT